MLRLIFIIVCICTVYSCKSQATLEDDIYEAIENIIEEMEGEDWIKDGKPKYQYILDKPFMTTSIIYEPEKLFVNETFDKYFSIEDKVAFQNQIEWYKDFYYREDKIISKEIIHKQELEKIILNDRKSFWEVYISTYGDVGFYDISFPLFSVDKKKMLVSIESCLPYICRNGIYLFEKENGKWKIKDGYIGI